MGLCLTPAKLLPRDFIYLVFDCGRGDGWGTCHWRLIQITHGQLEAGVPAVHPLPWGHSLL